MLFSRIIGNGADTRAVLFLLTCPVLLTFSLAPWVQAQQGASGHIAQIVRAKDLQVDFTVVPNLWQVRELSRDSYYLGEIRREHSQGWRAGLVISTWSDEVYQKKVDEIQAAIDGDPDAFPLRDYWNYRLVSFGRANIGGYHAFTYRAQIASIVLIGTGGGGAEDLRVPGRGMGISEFYYFRIGENNVMLESSVTYEEHFTGLSQLEREYQSVLEGIRFQTPDSDGASPLSGFPWMVVVGGMTAAAVAAVLSRIRRRRKSDEQDPDEPEDAEYILQLNRDHFSLGPGTSEVLEIQAWKVAARGQAPSEAPITIENPEPNLHLSSSSGRGTLTTTMELRGEFSSRVVRLRVLATAGGQTVEKVVQVVPLGDFRIALSTRPQGRRSLRPDTFQVLTVLAEVVDERGQNSPEHTQLLEFCPESDWIDLSEPVWDGSVLAINVGASNPTPHLGQVQPPQAVTLRVDLTEQGCPPLQQELQIELLDSRLETEINDCTFPAAETKIEVRFRASILDGPGDHPWTFEAEYQHGRRPVEPLTEISLEPISEEKVEFILTGPSRLPERHQSNLVEMLVIKAFQGQEKPLERSIRVEVAQIGLYFRQGLDKDGRLPLLAKEPLEINLDLSVMGFDPDSEKVHPDPQRMAEVSFELLNTEEKTLNLVSVLEPRFEFEKLIQGESRARYKLTTAETIPGMGEVFSLLFHARSPVRTGEDPDLFVKELEVLVRTYYEGIDDPDWDEAYIQCRYSLVTFVLPHCAHAYTRLMDLLEERKLMLGVEGMVEMRNQIWGIAQNLILSEGARGYKSEERWNHAVVVVLEWVEWAGNIAFSALIAHAYAAKVLVKTGVGILKSVLVDAIKFVAFEDEPISTFVNHQYDRLWSILFGAVKGRYINVPLIKKKLNSSLALAYVVYAGIQFAIHLYQKRSLMEAARAAFWELTDEALINLLVGKLDEDSVRVNRKVVDVHESLEDILKEVEEDPYGREFINRKKLLEIMRDPAQIRTIKNHAPPFLKKIFNESKQQIYNDHDANLKLRLAKKYKLKVEDILIDDFRTPGSDPDEVNTDRDYRVLLRKNGGAQGATWYELQTANWLEDSYEEFGRLTQKPDSISAEDWAVRKHLQRGTDRFDAEACLDFTDQWFDDASGRMRQGSSNYQNVKSGKGRLIDAEGMGQMYVNKVKNAQSPGTESEGYAQAQKAIKSLQGVRKSYQEQGLTLDPLPQHLQAAMEVVSEAPVDVTMAGQRLQSVQKNLEATGYASLDQFVQELNDSGFRSLAKFDDPSDGAKAVRRARS